MTERSDADSPVTMSESLGADSPATGAAGSPLAVYGVAGAEADAPFPGVRRRTYQTVHATVTSYEFEPGGRFPMHSHPEEQITVFLEGEMEVTVDGKVSVHGPGETVVLPGGVAHGMRSLAGGAQFLAIIVPRRSRADAYELMGE